jgi:hypothetical protein
MGMFDTILIHKSIILPLLEGEELLKEKWRTDTEDCFHFQTKDLENFMWLYKVGEDHKVWREVHEYVEDPECKFGMRHERRPDERCEKLNAYINFYDMVRHIGEDEVWIEFEGHILNGQLAEVSLVKLEKTNMAHKEAEMQKQQLRWDKIRNTYSWKTFSAIRDVEWKLRRLFRPVFNKYENFLNKLRKDAENQYPSEE